MARIFDEKLEGAGYEEAGWTEQVGIGCTVDEDADPADAGSPSGWESQCLKIIKAANVVTYTFNQIGDAGIRYTRIEVVFTDISNLGIDEWALTAFATDNAGSNYCWELYVYNNAGTKRLYLQSWHNGIGHGFEGPAVSEDTRYRIELKWDSTNNLWEWKIDDISQDSGSLTAGHVEMGIIVLGTSQQYGNEPAWEVYYDLIAIDDAGWVGAEPGITVPPTTLAPTLPPTTIGPTTVPPVLPFRRRGISNLGFSLRDSWR